jgi:hypothetical protein
MDASLGMPQWQQQQHQHQQQQQQKQQHEQPSSAAADADPDPTDRGRGRATDDVDDDTDEDFDLPSGGGGGKMRSNALDTAGMDPRRAKRILANRQSAQRSRMKRLQHVHELENHAADLNGQIKRLQGQLSGERGRADDAAAAAASAAAAAAALQQQLAQQEALQAVLQTQIVALRTQAAASGIMLPPPSGVAVAPMLPPHTIAPDQAHLMAAAVTAGAPAGALPVAMVALPPASLAAPAAAAAVPVSAPASAPPPAAAAASAALEVPPLPGDLDGDFAGMLGDGDDLFGGVSLASLHDQEGDPEGGGVASPDGSLRRTMSL